ncbi:iron uptake system protein EfeO [Priestia koreensis]|uniref:iron uptake system protein EfeO n=1 Tax=Priestia koreensis TaxID=284581 RepID=UPI001F5A0B5C|nr:iron uptake system protein EfeO [Priestia koreensis]UNL85775.1 Efem/EfeO family lipoprotein [Priestia koreensis]
MSVRKKFVYTALTLSLFTVPALSACGADKASEPTKAESSQKDGSMKENVKSMQKTLAALQAGLDKKDEEKVVAQGKKLNDQWLSYETEIREKYPLLYTDAEKYLQPLYNEVTKEKVDLDKIQEIGVQAGRSLDQLANAKKAAAKTSEALDKAVADYKTYVEEQTEELVKTTTAFTDAVRANDAEKAKFAYGQARVYYERIEPIAESFGDLDPKIDARENDVSADEWSGFHRIEKALWKDGSLEGMATYADQLDKDVAELQGEIKNVKLTSTQVVAGSMELLNEAAISKVTGEEERYSHIDLVDLAANVEGSQAIYHAILPALTDKNPDLSNQLDTEFNQLTETLTKYKQGDSYVAYTTLSKEQVRELSQQLSSLSESMAQTAEIFQ